MSTHEPVPVDTVVADETGEVGLEKAYDYASLLSEHFKPAGLQLAGHTCQGSHERNGLICLGSVVWIEGYKAVEQVVGNVICCLTLRLEGEPKTVVRAGKNALDAAFAAVRSLAASWHLFAHSLSLCVDGYVPLQTGITADVTLSLTVSSGTRSAKVHMTDQNLNIAALSAIIEAVNQLGSQR